MRNALYFTAEMLIVGVLHFALLFGLYYVRVGKLLPGIASDLLVFHFPSILAFGAYCYFTWRNMFSSLHFALRTSLTALVAFLASAVSFSVFGMVAFNIWGT